MNRLAIRGKTRFGILAVLLVLNVGCLRPLLPPAVTAWFVSGDEELTASTPPQVESPLYSQTRGLLRVEAALNETISVQLALRAPQGARIPCDIHLDDFHGPAGPIAAGKIARFYRVHDVPVDQFRAWYGQQAGRAATPTSFPDVLVPWDAPLGGGPAELDEHRNTLVWIDLYAPPTIPPGTYASRLAVRDARGVTLFGCVVQVDVLPVALPGRRSLPVVCRVDPAELLNVHFGWTLGPPEQIRLVRDWPDHAPAVRLVDETMRLLHEHRLSPFLCASFPKFTPTGPGEVTIHWDDYDALVEPWVEGRAYPDRVRPAIWPLPFTLGYPDANREGGVQSSAYGRLAAAYVRECARHFSQRGWGGQALLRPIGPEPHSAAAIERLRRLCEVVRRSEVDVPLVVHQPIRSLRGLGWFDAPTMELSAPGIWAPPASWFEPAAARAARQSAAESGAQVMGLGRPARQTWFIPDHAPYSGSLAIEAPAIEARVLPWLAYRYEAGAIWLEHVAQTTATAGMSTPAEPWRGEGLVRPGVAFGLRHRAVPTIRLKRLRRGLQDYELLRLLQENGQTLLARQLAAQLVTWAFTDACRESLVSCRPSGWPASPDAVQLARQIALDELTFGQDGASTARGDQQRIDRLARWGLLSARSPRFTASFDGARLEVVHSRLVVHVVVEASNATPRSVSGSWRLSEAPPGWQLRDARRIHIAPGSHRRATLQIDVPSLGYSADGVYPFQIVLESPELGNVVVPARLAVLTAARPVLTPVIDGRLDDWPLGGSNSAGSFLLCRLAEGAGPSRSARTPALETRGYALADATHLYLAVRCSTQPGRPPRFRSDNVVRVDGGIPWGEDLVEILLNPGGGRDDLPEDVLCLQVKPNGVSIARRGPLTAPPTAGTEPWNSGAAVAVTQDDASWNVEARIPWLSLLRETGSKCVLGFNLTRLDAARGEYSSWSGATAPCYHPARLGCLVVGRGSDAQSHSSPIIR